MVFGWLSAGLRRADADSRRASTAPVASGGPEYAASGMVASPGLGARGAEPDATALAQAQQLLAQLNWCPRIDSADTRQA